MRKYKSLIIIIILFIFYNSFFINKALHIDDPFTIRTARVANDNFLRPIRAFFMHPPFLGYYYAPIIRIFSESEPWLHIFYLPFSLLVIVSMYSLSSRFTDQSLFPTLFLISSSAFILSSQSIMFDIPLLGFSLAAIAVFIYGIDRNKNSLLVLSGLLATIAILTKYSGFMVLGILAIYCLLNSRKKKLIFLVIPALIFVLWDFYSSLLYPEAIFSKSITYRMQNYLFNRIGIRILASLSFLSGTALVILLLIPFLLRKRKDQFCFLLALTSGILPFVIKSVFNDYSSWEKLSLAVLFIASSYIILLISKAGLSSLLNKNNKDTLFLACWFFLVFIFSLLTNFIAARFTLLLLPPLFLLMFNKLSSGNFATVKPKLNFIILISVIFSTVLAIGDYQFAGLYRHFVSSFKEPIPLKKRVRSHFYHGSYYYSWGYAYYLEKFPRYVSMDYAVKGNLDQPHVILITPTEPVLPIIVTEKRYPLDKFLHSDHDRILINLVDTVYYRGNVFLHNRKFHAGFYCHDWGLLPFYLSVRKVPLEGFEVYGVFYSPKDDS